MTEPWKDWEGQVVDTRFPLHRFLGDNQHSGVFMTEFGAPAPQKAAIKLLRAEPDQAGEVISRWESAAKLSHPHLVRLFEMGRTRIGDGELLYLVMEYADENLAQVIPDRPLTEMEAREMLEPALDALMYLHRTGFTHGHLKPANLLAVGDQLKISSDGVSRTGETRARARADIYDPPEIAESGMTPAGDVWALGVSLVEALTQLPPVWQGTDREQALLPSAMPEMFADIVRHSLVRDPRRRWTPADIAARLRGIMPAAAQPAVAKRRRSLAPAVIAGVALIAAVVYGPRLMRRNPVAVPPPAAAEQPRVRPEPAALPPAKTEQTPSAAPAFPALESEPKPKTSRSRAAAGIVHQVLPDIPGYARNTIRGKVRVGVRVAVDDSGKVTAARLDPSGPSRFFAKRALEAARRWKFTPAKSEWLLRFEFDRATTTVAPVRTAP